MVSGPADNRNLQQGRRFSRESGRSTESVFWRGHPSACHIQFHPNKKFNKLSNCVSPPSGALILPAASNLNSRNKTRQKPNTAHGCCVLNRQLLAVSCWLDQKEEKAEHQQKMTPKQDLEAEKLAEIAVRDPLSETTRRERKTLLGISIVVIGIIETGTLPTKIESLGIEFTQTDQKYLFNVFAAVVIYYLIAFVLFAISDFIVWRIAFGSIVRAQWGRMTMNPDKDKLLTKDEQRIIQLEKQITEMKAEQMRGSFDKQLGLDIDFMNWGMPNYLIRLSTPVSLFRSIFEFLLPILVGIYALILLFVHKP